ncbi:MAG TPA: sigma-70 family RNA polymerase sigma factor [Lachnospiraceae bacterium]|nr:sigma-70 family RNA polymerase sigma factor [Lachnospiraceae bacterium]
MTEERFEQCIFSMNRREKDGLKEVYEEYISYIYGIVRNMLINKEEAEDVTSEFFIRLWEKSGSYKPGSGHKGWMATIARNLAVDHIRKNKRVDIVDFSAERGEESQEQASVSRNRTHNLVEESVEEQVVSSVSMREALATLKEVERQVIHMKIMAEMTFQEIADILQEPLGTVAWRYREAVKKLRRCGYEESGR